MINDLRIVFLRTFEIITSYPQILRLSLSLFALNVMLNLGKEADLVCINGLLGLGIGVFSILLQIYFILYVYRIESALGDEVNIWTEARKLFWKCVLQFVVGLLTSAVISLPFLLIIAIISRYDKSLGVVLFLILFQFFLYLGLGAVTLSQRILLQRNRGILENLGAGLKELSDHGGYYFTFFIITSMITIGLFWLFGILGSALTNVDIFSVPIIPLLPFLGNYSQATSPFAIQLLTQFVYVFINPYISIATTLSYLKRKNYENN